MPPMPTFHNLYLQDGSVSFTSSVHFEDGMDYDECDAYYSCVMDQDSRISYHLSRATTQLTCPKTKKQLLQQYSNKPTTLLEGHRQQQLVSCLRPSSYNNNTKKQQSCLRPSFLLLQRSISFNTLPRLNNLYADYLGETMMELRKRPRVTFSPYVEIVTIAEICDYPHDVQKSLWMTRHELSCCLQSAMLENLHRQQQQRKRQQQQQQQQQYIERRRQLAALLDVTTTTKTLSSSSSSLSLHNNNNNKGTTTTSNNNNNSCVLPGAVGEQQGSPTARPLSIVCSQ